MERNTLFYFISSLALFLSFLLSLSLTKSIPLICGAFACNFLNWKSLPCTILFTSCELNAHCAQMNSFRFVSFALVSFHFVSFRFSFFFFHFFVKYAERVFTFIVIYAPQLILRLINWRLRRTRNRFWIRTRIRIRNENTIKRMKQVFKLSSSATKAFSI